MCHNIGHHLVDTVTSRCEHHILEGRQLVLQGLINQWTKDLATLYGVIGVSCNAVSPAEVHGASAEVEKCLRAMPAHIVGVVSHGVRVGATRALAAA